MDELRKLAQTLAHAHYAVACSDDSRVAVCTEPVYQGTLQAMSSVIELAYPDVDVREVYDAMVDCGFDVEYCVGLVRSAH